MQKITAELLWIIATQAKAQGHQAKAALRSVNRVREQLRRRLGLPN